MDQRLPTLYESEHGARVLMWYYNLSQQTATYCMGMLAAEYAHLVESPTGLLKCVEAKVELRSKGIASDREGILTALRMALSAIKACPGGAEAAGEDW